MIVRPICEIEKLAPLAEAWNALAGGVPFRRFEWLESWWRHYGCGEPGSRNAELLVLAIYEDHASGFPIAVAPWYVSAGRSLGPLGRVIRFLGSGEVCSDYLSILCGREREAEIAATVADWLSGEADGAWDALELTAVAENDRVVAQVVANLRGRGHVCHQRTGDSCWRLVLPRTWDGYLDELSKSHRRQMRRADRDAFESDRAKVHTVTATEELAGALRQFVDLHQRRRTSLGDPGCFSSPRFSSFLAEVSGRMLKGGQLRLNWLEYDAQVVATDYLLVDGGVVFAYQGGLDPGRLELEPGNLLAMAEIRQAIEEGLSAVDFLRGDEPYKAHWRARPHATLDYRVSAGGMASRLRHGLWLSRQRARTWARQGLQLAANLGGFDPSSAGEQAV